MEAETVDTPYRSVRHALSRAFAGEERVICKSPMLMGSRAGQGDLTPYDYAAQDAVIVSLVYHHCRSAVIAAVTAQYMPDSLTMARGLTLTKHGAIRMCVSHIQSYPTLAGYPRDYLTDVVRVWSGATPSKPEPVWMDELGKSSRTLRNIKQGNRQRGRPGVMPILDDLLSESERTMGPIMKSRGIVPGT